MVACSVASAYSLPTHKEAKHSTSVKRAPHWGNGVVSGRVQRASTHASGIGVDIAVVERDCATVDVDATSVLPNNGGMSVSEHPIGAMGRWGDFVV